MRQRRQFSTEFKVRIVLEVLSGQKRAAGVCREHQLKPDQLSRWKADFVSQAASVFAGDVRSQRSHRPCHRPCHRACCCVRRYRLRRRAHAPAGLHQSQQRR